MSSSRTKILHVYKDFHVYNAFFGALLLLAKHTDYDKYDLILCVFSYKESPWGKEFERLGGRIIDLGAKWTENPLITLKLVKCFKMERPDIVQTHELKANLYGRIAANLAGVPVIISTIWTLQDTAPSLRRLRDVCLHPISRILDRQSSRVVTISDAIRREWDASLSSPLYQRIYLPHDLERDQKSSEDQRILLTAMDNPGTINIGAVSRLSEEKGIQFLLKAVPLIARQISHFKVYIAGEGNYRRHLHSLVESLHVQRYVQFVGFLDNVPEFLQQLDLYVQPSRSESLGVAIMEAMSAGLPVVATRVGGIPEIIADNVSGLLVPSQNADVLAEAIVALCRDSEMRQRMGTAGKQLIDQRFRVSDFIRQMYDLYEELLEKKGLASRSTT
jgi:glycosyltransferase involved in cell wall biosynthesis